MDYRTGLRDLGIRLRGSLVRGEPALDESIGLALDYERLIKSVDTGEKWKVIREIALQGNAPKPYVSLDGKVHVTLQDLKREKYDPTDDWVRYTDVPIEWRAEALSQAQKASVMHGTFKVWNSFFDMFVRYADVIDECPILGLLGWYLSHFETEPFLQHSNGSVTLLTEDHLCANRIKLLRNGINMWCEVVRRSKDVADVIEETVLFMLPSPFSNALKLKDGSEVFKSIVGAGCPGIKVRWASKRMDRCSYENIDGKVDLCSYYSYLEDWDEEQGLLKGYGLVKLAAMHRSCVGPTGAWGLNEAYIQGILTFPEATAGFIHMINGNAMKKAFDKVAAMKRPSDPLFKPKLYDLFVNFFNYLTLPTEQEAIHDLAGSVTTKSAGLPKDERTVMNVVGVNPDGRQTTMRVAINDKILTFYNNPQQFLDMRSFSWGARFRPGKVATRNVPGRKVRAVFITTPQQFFISNLFVRQLRDWQISNFIDSKGGRMTTFTGTTGSPLADHSTWVINASSSNNEIIVGADFSSFDTTIGPAVYLIIKEALAASKVKLDLRKFSNGYTIFEMIDASMSRMLEHFWNIDVLNVPTLFSSNHQLSGVFETTLTNNMVNKAAADASWDYIEERMPGYFKRGTMQIQGDDQEFIMTCTEKFLKLSAMEQGQALRRFRDLLVEAVGKCGLVVNSAKTSTRKTSQEFLRKSSNNGMIIPRLTQLQQYENEKQSGADDPVDKMIAEISFYREVVARGGDFLSALVHLWIARSVSKNVKVSGREEIEMPFEGLFAPISHGGCGMPPWNFMVPNSDAAILSTVYASDRFMSHMWRYISASRAKADHIESTAEQIVDEYMTKGIDLIKANENKQQLLASEGARTALLARGYKDDLSYAIRYKAQVAGVIQQNPAFNWLRKAQKVAKSQALYNAFVAEYQYPVQIESPDWIITYGEELKHTDVVQFMAIDPVVWNWMATVGVSAEKSEKSTSLLNLMGKLTNAPGFPSNVPGNSPQALARTMSQNGLTSAPAITELLISRGGDPNLAVSIGQKIASDISSIEVLAEASNVSSTADGYTDGSRIAMARCVEYSGPSDQNIHTAGLIVGLTVCKTQSPFHPIRRVHIRPSLLLEAKIAATGISAAYLSQLTNLLSGHPDTAFFNS